MPQGLLLYCGFYDLDLITKKGYLAFSLKLSHGPILERRILKAMNL